MLVAGQQTLHAVPPPIGIQTLTGIGDQSHLDWSAIIFSEGDWRACVQLRPEFAAFDYGHSHGVIGRTLMETAGEHVAILYNSADGRFVCVMLLATLSFPKRNAAHSDHFA